MSEKSFVSSESVFFEDVLAILRKSRQKAYRAVNSSMVEAYWLIGKRIIVEEQKGKDRAKYGEKLIRNISIQLNKEFGKGFSYANLKNFRQFYITFANDEKGYTLCSLLSWSHIRLIMRLDDRITREYYLTEAREQDWSVRQVESDTEYHCEMRASYSAKHGEGS